MNTKIRKLLLVCSCSPLLMSVLCEKEDDFSSLIYPETKVTLSEGPIFSTNDTLWISGEVTTMLFDEIAQDSILNTNGAINTTISVLRLKPADRNSNTVEAINEFELVTRIGSIDLGVCPEAELIANGPRTENGKTYRYEIGLVPKNTGDFALNWLLGADLKNNNLNLEILEKYPINGDINQLGLTKCGITSTKIDLRESKDEFFFTVE